jgi:hypothetical protein
MTIIFGFVALQILSLVLAANWDDIKRGCAWILGEICDLISTVAYHLIPDTEDTAGLWVYVSAAAMWIYSWAVTANYNIDEKYGFGWWVPWTPGQDSEEEK